MVQEQVDVQTICPISTKFDTLISVILLPITMLALGFSYYLFYIKLSAFPFILLATLLFGFSCMGLIRMWKLKTAKTCFQ